MKSLNQDLKTGQFKQIYLLFGEEGYLKKQYKERFVKAMLPQDDTMNYTYYEGKNVNIAEVIDQAETMPFFAERRLIVFEETGLFKTGGSDLGDYIKDMPDTTYMIFSETEVDKRSKLYKAVKAKGHIVELQRQDETTLKRWITGKVKAEGKKISESCVYFFMGKVGSDMGTISLELEKLLSYTLDKDIITEEDIDAVCVNQITNSIFDMIEAMTARRQREALDMYYGLLAAKEPPMRILFLMTRQYKYLYEIKDLMRRGCSRKEIASKMNLHPFIAGKYMDQTKKFTSVMLREILEESADLEERVKTGRLADVLAVELFLIKYTSRPER